MSASASQSIKNTLPKRLSERYQRWINKRLPAVSQITLNQSNLFIFLSKEGAYYLVLAVLLWIGATNYQNNLVYGLCFLLLAILFLVIHYTFANVSGLTLSFISANPIFSGDVAQFKFLLQSRREKHQLFIGWEGESESLIEVPAHQPTFFWLSAHTKRRGVYRPGRFLLKSVFPVGIVQCWTWLDLCAEVVVYPNPIEADYTFLSRGNIENQGVMMAGADDYFALKPYVQGDALSRVAWKQHAAGRGLFVREYVDYRGADIWLDYSVMSDADPELRLSKLCYCALQLHEQSRVFGLRLPDKALEPNVGQAHLESVLDALARCDL
jgi:uncharacterized protein (DUF58 family)